MVASVRAAVLALGEIRTRDLAFQVEGGDASDAELHLSIWLLSDALLEWASHEADRQGNRAAAEELDSLYSFPKSVTVADLEALSLERAGVARAASIRPLSAAQRLESLPNSPEVRAVRAVVSDVEVGRIGEAVVP